ncbi:MAG: hypothetical protein EBX52_11435 [Proteobacteria bacterium]|nr:hypothetical protein [Pseudomonadota bacterium]
MMKSNWIGLVCAVIALTACGKSLRVTQKPAGLNGAGQGGGNNRITSPIATQTLGAISQADAKEISDKKLALPFTSGEDKVDFRTIGSPTGKSSKDAAFVKSNNVVFRSIINVPKAEQVEEVKSLSLTLENWSLVESKEGAAPESTILCLVGGETIKKSCFGKVKLETALETKDSEPVAGEASGADPASSGGANPIEIKAAKANAEFFNDLKIAAGVDTKMEESGEIAATKEKIMVAKKVEIDLLKVFGIKPADALKWITDNSVDFDGKGHRKVRFVMGDQLYASGGSLVLNVTMKKGAPAEEAVGTPTGRHAQDL